MRAILLCFCFMFCCFQGAAQPFLIADCSPRNICLLQGSCTRAYFTMTAEADNGCGGSTVNIGWQLDLHNDGGINRIGGTPTFADTLPVGTHRLIWRAIDACFLSDTCHVILNVRDCLPPAVTAVNGFNSTLDPADSCRLTIRASQYIVSLSDNCTPRNQIALGLRKAGSGTGFPADSTVTFGRCNHGTQIVELWARDHGGLMSQTNVYVIVQDGLNNCPCDTITPPPPPPPPPPVPAWSGCIEWPDQTKFEVGPYSVSINNPSNPPAFPPQFLTVDTSCFSSIAWPITPQFISLHKNDSALYEVNLLDVLKIQRHLLALEPLTNVFARKAADVNNNNAITSSDMVEMRKLILGAYTEFPNRSSFEFFSARLFARNGQLHQLDTLQPHPVPNNFIAVKVGNVDTRMSTKLMNPSDRGVAEFSYAMDKTGHYPRLIISSAQAQQNVLGWQFGLDGLPPIVSEQLSDMMHQDAEGNLRVLKQFDQPTNLTEGQVLLELSLARLPDFGLRLAPGFDAMMARVEGNEIMPQAIYLNASTAIDKLVPVLLPNPVQAGGSFLLQAHAGTKWQLRDLNGSVISTGSLTQEITQMTAPEQGGVYLLIIGNEAKKLLVLR